MRFKLGSFLKQTDKTCKYLLFILSLLKEEHKKG